MRWAQVAGMQSRTLNTRVSHQPAEVALSYSTVCSRILSLSPTAHQARMDGQTKGSCRAQ